MEYFQQFPTMLYTFDPNKIEYTTVRNIFARVKIIDDILQNSLVYYQYNMKDGDNAEIVADKYYGDTKRHWMVFFANRVVDPYFDMPLKQHDLEQNIIAKYGSLSNAQAVIHHVEQRTNVTTSLFGTTTTEQYVATLNQPYTYNFALKQVQGVTLPTIGSPTLQQSTSSITLADGSVVTTTVVLQAVTNYDYEVSVNESKRQVQLIDKQYASMLEKQLTSLLSE